MHRYSPLPPSPIEGRGEGCGAVAWTKGRNHEKLRA